MRSYRHRDLAVGLVWSVALAVAGCGKKGDERSGGQPEVGTADPADPADPVDPPQHPVAKPPSGPTGTITGKVTLTGTPPPMPQLQRGSDGFCAKKEMTAETVLTGPGGALQNALVRIAPGAVPGWVPSDPVQVDQVDCMYRPRVQGGVRGQMMVVKNSDGTMHNVNARRLPWGERRDTETIFNRGQPAGGPPLETAIEEADILKLKCDAHGWMQGYVVVGDSPYHAVSGGDGSFTIERAPVGTYQLQAWHEFYGIKTASVTVAEGASAAVKFTFDADKDRPASAGGAATSGAAGTP